MRESAPSDRDPFWLHLGVVLALSVAWESLFLKHGINKLDEGWPLYAAMQMHAGARLYSDVLWVFPPLHTLPAWIGYALDPPGFGLTRILYAAFAVALSGGVYVLGRRVMPARFALLGAILVAIAAPRSHPMHLLFGYRYLVFTVLALLAFHRRLATGDHRMTFVAGLFGGIALAFRLTPAFAVSCAIAVAAVAADRDWRHWLRDWCAYAAGLVCTAGPVVAYFAWDVGFGRMVYEVLVHPLAMLQPLPIPVLDFPNSLSRLKFSVWFVALEFRLFLALYAAYAISLGVLWVRALRERKPFEHTMLLAIVVWGGVYYVRSLGRSDEPHLDSAIPPALLLLAHGLHVVLGRVRESARPVRRERIACAGLLVLWILLTGTDAAVLNRNRNTGRLEIEGEEIYVSATMATRVNSELALLRRITKPGDKILDLSASPFWHVMLDRPGYGEFDVIMLGTFVTPAEELGFLDRVRADPPAAVIWPRWVFDKMVERSVSRTAPRLARWVDTHYRELSKGRYYIVMVPKDPLFRTRAAKPDSPE